MPKLAVLHYLPLEYYPPVTNLIDYLVNERRKDFNKVKVFSCRNVKGRKRYKAESRIHSDVAERQKCIKIKRSPFPKETDNSLIRLLKYLHYNLFTLINLISYQPNNLLYYESYSAWPTFIYTRYFNRKCRVFIHNHEYASKEWYRKTMKQVQYFHQLEKKWLYPRATWLSQTNSDRLQFFHQDHPYLKKEQLKVMPNYPPKEWRKEKGTRYKVQGTKYKVQGEMHENPLTLIPKPLTLVYVGSLSFQSTYLKELCEWVVSQNGKIQFDVYAYNLYKDVKAYFKELSSPYINYYEQGIEYNDQPKVLGQYDVGLILYKAHNQNYTYNAPNKLFEYLACDLDVWYPDVLQGPKQYNTETTYPKVVPVDFEDLESFDYNKANKKEGHEYKPSEYYCEEVYKELVDEIIEE